MRMNALLREYRDSHRRQIIIKSPNSLEEVYDSRPVEYLNRTHH